MEAVLNVINSINLFLWSGPVLIVLCTTHLFFTLRLKFVQRHIGKAIRSSFSDSGHTNSLRTLTTTLAATLGTGNIVGISTAIELGGAGAVFWCWLTGIFGMATTYAESYLGIRYQKKLPDGTKISGPMVAYSEGLHCNKIAILYTFLLLASGLGMSSTTSSVIQNVVSKTSLLPDNRLLFFCIAGILTALLVGFIINGGAKTVTDFCLMLVPCMALLYFGLCLILLILNRTSLLPALLQIFRSAFGLRPVAAGILGGSLQLALRYGIARGLFTNEAGLGSSAVSASDSNNTCEQQGLISMSATFWDTVIMCALTGLVIVSSLLQHNESGNGANAGELVQLAFSRIPLGSFLLNFSLFAFAFATLIGWYYIAEKAATHLALLCSHKVIRYVSALRLFYMLSIFLGFVFSMELIFACSDLLNAVLIIPSVLSLYLFRKTILPVKENSSSNQASPPKIPQR